MKITLENVGGKSPVRVHPLADHQARVEVLYTVRTDSGEKAPPRALSSGVNELVREPLLARARESLSQSEACRALARLRSERASVARDLEIASAALAESEAKRRQLVAKLESGVGAKLVALDAKLKDQRAVEQGKRNELEAIDRLIVETRPKAERELWQLVGQHLHDIRADLKQRRDPLLAELLAAVQEILPRFVALERGISDSLNSGQFEGMAKSLVDELTIEEGKTA